MINRFMDKVMPDPTSGCWHWLAFCDRHGYGKFSVGKKRALAHRVAYELFKGEIPDGHVVMHSCDVRCCVNPDHLATGTTAENNTDMWRKGRQGDRGGCGAFPGERHHNASLSADVVRNIYHSKGRTVDVAKQFNVIRETVYKIKKGLRWTSVTGHGKEV